MNEKSCDLFRVVEVEAGHSSGQFVVTRWWSGGSP